MSRTISISRRQFIVGAGALSVLAATYAGYRQVGNYPTKPDNIEHLTDKEFAIYQAIGNVIIPEGGPLPGTGGDEISMKMLDSMFENIPEGKRELLGALPLVFEHGTVLDSLGSQCFTNLTFVEQNKYIQRWATSGLLIPAQLFAALKTLYGFSYFERDDVLRAMNMPPFCYVSSRK